MHGRPEDDCNAGCLCHNASWRALTQHWLITLQDSVEDKWREQKAAAAGEEAGDQEVDEQGKPLTKKVRQQLKRAAEKERARQREAQQDRMEPQVTPHYSRPENHCHAS